MGDIFLKLLNMSITASWLILAVLCIRFLFRKIPKWITCLLWGVVAIRLICLLSIESTFSLQPSAETVNSLLAETFAYQETESVAPLQVFIGIAGSVCLRRNGLLIL